MHAASSRRTIGSGFLTGHRGIGGLVKPLRFSHHFGVTRSNDDDWFDPLLNEDTKLYVDPFLIFLETDSSWANAHARLMRFFDVAMKMLAESGFNRTAPLFRKAQSLLLFPEPPEFCLGVSKKSVLGAGSAKGLQAGMIEGAAVAIDQGIESLRHFEELALFGGQIGPDRIGDITCNVLKQEFIEYTQNVAIRHGVPLRRVNVRNAAWDETRRQWVSQIVELPLNPVATAQAGYPIGVLLTPERFLRRTPNIDPEDFWEFAWSVEGSQLKADFNYEIATSVDRETIIRLARRRRRLLSQYLDHLAGSPKRPYDVNADPDLIVKRADFGTAVASLGDGLATPRSEDELITFTRAVIDNFRACVEKKGPGSLLWVDGKPRQERHAQALFYTSAHLTCMDRDIDLTPEAETGRGPVDFKLSHGHSVRTLVEVKLAKSSTFWKNLENQTPIYLRAEGLKAGFFVVIQYTDKDCGDDFVKKAKEIGRRVAEQNDIAFEVVFVDARVKESASKVGASTT
jgi:hypothetical protein